MRHYKKGRKLGTDCAHTKAMKKSLAVALFTNDRIKTTDSRAKEMRSLVDKAITWAKRGDLHSRRLAIAALGDKEIVREIFEKAKQGMWADRPGGYTRIMKLGPRKGDNAPMVIIELVSEVCVPKAKRAEIAAKAAEGKKKAKKDKKDKKVVDKKAEDSALAPDKKDAEDKEATEGEKAAETEEAAETEKSAEDERAAESEESAEPEEDVEAEEATEPEEDVASGEKKTSSQEE